MTFNYYAGKDVPAATYATEHDCTLDELKALCRQEESCAGFATDGTLKRFIPHKCSNFDDIQHFTSHVHVTRQYPAGLYVKVPPGKCLQGRGLSYRVTWMTRIFLTHG